MPQQKHFETEAIRTQVERSQEREHSAPLYLTSSFVFNDAEQARALFANEYDGNIYSRFSNPNVDEFTEKLAKLEGCDDGLGTASGMAAVFASLAGLCQSGDHILACRSLFGSSHQILTQILPKWGIEHTYVDILKPETWEAEIRPNTKIIFAETPSNPAIDLIDLEWLGKLAQKHQLLLNIDNCWPTPYLQQPAKFGAQIVTHSATKYLDGQGRTVGGAILGREDLIKELRFFCRQTGPALSPFNAWVLSKSMETLAIRMERHSENALKVAQFLEAHPEVQSVKYPFLPSHPQYEVAKRQMKMGGGMITFFIKGGLERGRQFLDSVRMASLTANLGDTRTIVTHPASTTHSKLTPEAREQVGIFDNLIRISVGLEHTDDIIEDLSQAIDASKQ